MGKNANIRAKVTTENITRTSATYHFTSWLDTTNYSGSSNSLNLAPSNLEFLTGEHMRCLISDPKSPASTRIRFQRPFITPPKVVVFFNYIDLDKRRNWRLKTTATDIDINGFTLNIETWDDTILYAAQAAWVAYPEDKPYIFSTSVNTHEVRAWYKPQLTQSKSINFADVEFLKDPNVFVAWNMFDIDCCANFRLSMYADNITQQGLTWHIDTWMDTVLYSAGATIVAVN
jgi:H-type lectin domain